MQSGDSRKRTIPDQKITCRRTESTRRHPPVCGRVERSEGRAINEFATQCNRGFSLIELIVVLVLTAILASLTTFSLRGVIVRQRLGRAVEVVKQFDTALRRAARHQRRQVAAVIDRGRGRLTIDPSGESMRTFTLPRQVSIDTIRFGPVPASRSGAQVTADPDGSTSSYALRLTTGDSGHWIFLAGGSGQIVDDFDPTAIELALGMR
ncbi:type II secretion system protein [Rhodopirellula sp. JC639]|uniref:type II secretion system protein n=1 Tax=Stieleria mannarensis TaxID=2755585 RepID=UPI00256FCBF0|nr:type II secretion system protein [Rhodopirellula sp. JC639]